jgi:hypothetical protein
MWRAYLADTMTGLIDSPLDLPSFSWSMSIGDFALTTTRGKDVGEGEASGIRVPWDAVPGSTPSARAREVCADRRSVVLFWRSSWTPEGELGTPVMMGAITPRTDTWLDTSFSLDSPMGILSSRYLVREGTYGADKNGTTSSVFSWSGMSLRGIASEVGWQCTTGKPGGMLPIDWQYRGERGGHERTYNGFDVQNLSCAGILSKLSDVQCGPDMRFRPYLADGQHVRLRFEAGSDADVYIGQDRVHRLACRRFGGDLEDVTVDHVGPVMRVYASGAGTDKAQLTCMGEDMSLCEQTEPWPLRETAWSDPDTDQLDLLRAHAAGMLAANRSPVMQIKGSIHANDANQDGTPLHPLGSMWPGETVEIALDGFPSLPDGVYRSRLMRMEGDETDRVDLTFDVMADPNVK